jgi:hypothetical protein
MNQSPDTQKMALQELAPDLNNCYYDYFISNFEDNFHEEICLAIKLLPFSTTLGNLLKFVTKPKEEKFRSLFVLCKDQRKIAH